MSNPFRLQRRRRTQRTLRQSLRKLFAAMSRWKPDSADWSDAVKQLFYEVRAKRGGAAGYRKAWFGHCLTVLQQEHARRKASNQPQPQG